MPLLHRLVCKGKTFTFLDQVTTTALTHSLTHSTRQARQRFHCVLKRRRCVLVVRLFRRVVFTVEWSSPLRRRV